MHLVIDGRLWENDSFSIINKNLAVSLHRLGYDVRLEAWEQGRDKPHRLDFLDYELLDALAAKPKDYDNAITIRQSWPRCDPYYSEYYNWDRISGKIKIGLLPWESDHVPSTWLPNMSRVDAIVAISPFSAGRLERELRRHRIHTPVWSTPLGVDMRIFNPSAGTWSFGLERDDTRGFRFLHVGVGQPRKGSDLLRQAYLEEFTDTDDCSLVVKTGGWDSSEWWTRGHPSHAPHMAVYHDDNIPEVLLGGLYTSCDVLVHPSRLEGFGLTMLEAMACGVPVICTGAGAHRVFADENNAILLPSTEIQFAFFQDLVTTAHEVSVSDLRSAMRSCYEGKRDMLQLIFNGMATAKLFSWERTAQCLVDHIRRSYSVELERNA